MYINTYIRTSTWIQFKLESLPLDFLDRELAKLLPDWEAPSPTEMENGVGVKPDEEGGEETRETLDGDTGANETVGGPSVSALTFLRTNKRI